MKKNYQYTKLTSKYELISEAHLNFKKEMFKEECWDMTSNSPVAECWNEFGQIKEQCWSHPSHSMRGGPLKKEMFKEECWDMTSNSPVAECWNEFGEIKQECWSSEPGAQTMTTPGYAGSAGGDSISESAKDPIEIVLKETNELKKSLKKLQEKYAKQPGFAANILKENQKRLSTLELDLEVLKSEVNKS